MKFLILNALLILLGVHLTTAQENTILTSGDESRIERADKKIGKAQSIVDKKEKYASKIEEAEGSGSKGKLRRYQTKANRIVITSASYFKEGYGKKYNAYKKVTLRGLKNSQLREEAVALTEQAKEDYRSGRKMRRKSSNESNVNKAVKLLMEANKTEETAIEKLIQTLGKAEEEEVEETVPDSLFEQADTAVVPVIAPVTEVVVSDSLVLDTISQTDTALIQASLVTDALTMVLDTIPTRQDTLSVFVATPILAEQAVIEEPVKKEIQELYFSVQFLAEKQPVPKDKIMSMYDGSFEVVKHEADGWFRYSFGRFKTLDEANEMKSKSGVQGYVVAYLNEVRISTRRAAEMVKM